MSYFEPQRAGTVKDVPADVFIAALAAHFKKTFSEGKIAVPEWTENCKTAPWKELAPLDVDWYFVRAASVARKIYINPGLGVGAFAKYIYGGIERRGCRRNTHGRAARGIVRNVLKQLEQLDIVAQRPDSKGRFITKNGQHQLDVIATQAISR
jgi:small subunit ribosomal protein S19e